MTTTIEIPSVLFNALSERLGEEGARRWTVETLVFAALRENRLAMDQAAEILSLEVGEVSELFSARGWPQ